MSPSIVALLGYITWMLALLAMLAIATDATAVTDGLAYYFLGARVLQSMVHLISSSNLAVQVRFAWRCVFRAAKLSPVPIDG